MTSFADFPTLIEKVGWAIAVILGLVALLRVLAKAFYSALNARIDVLEKVAIEREAEVRKLNRQMLDRADEHAKAQAEMFQKMAEALAEVSASSRALARAVTSRPCISDLHGDTSDIHKAIRHDPR